MFKDNSTGEEIKEQYDFLHVVPPMRAVDVVWKSKLVNESGFLNVDQTTLQHPSFPNVFALGDTITAPCAKTAAALFT